MTLQEILKAQNLTDDQIKAIADKMKEEKIFTAGEENLDIRYGKLKADYDSLSTQHGESEKLIAQLKKSGEQSDSMKSKIAEYEATIKKMESDNQQLRIENELKFALKDAGGSDIDYLVYKAREKNSDLKIGEDGKVAGLDDLVSELKTQIPAQFKVSSGVNGTKIEEKKLDESGNSDEGMTKEKFLRKSYNERLAFKQEHPEEFKNIMG